MDGSFDGVVLGNFEGYTLTVGIELGDSFSQKPTMYFCIGLESKLPLAISVLLFFRIKFPQSEGLSSKQSSSPSL